MCVLHSASRSVVKQAGIAGMLSKSVAAHSASPAPQLSDRLRSRVRPVGSSMHSHWLTIVSSRVSMRPILAVCEPAGSRGSSSGQHVKAEACATVSVQVII